MIYIYVYIYISIVKPSYMIDIYIYLCIYIYLPWTIPAGGITSDGYDPLANCVLWREEYFAATRQARPVCLTTIQNGDATIRG